MHSRQKNVQVEKSQEKDSLYLYNCKHDWQKIASTGNWQGQESVLPHDVVLCFYVVLHTPHFHRARMVPNC